MPWHHAGLSSYDELSDLMTRAVRFMGLIGCYPFTHSAAVAGFVKLQSLRTLARVEEAIERYTISPWGKQAVGCGFPWGDNSC